MWKKLICSDNFFYVKQESSDDNHSTTFTDMMSVWEESLSSDDIVNRFNEINPAIKAPKDSILKFLLSLGDKNDAVVEVQRRGEEVKITLSKVLIPKMKFEFNLKKKSEEALFRDITLPMLLYINELKNRQQTLCHLLEAKDLEIQEYKLEGFKITRKNVITEKFVKEDFERESKSQIMERLRTGVDQISEVISEDMNDFYPFYSSFILPIPLEHLKKNQAFEPQPAIKVEEQPKTPPRRKYSNEVSAPIKRIKLTNKKRIL